MGHEHAVGLHCGTAEGRAAIVSVRGARQALLPVRARLAGSDSHEVHKAPAECVLLIKKLFPCHRNCLE